MERFWGGQVVGQLEFYWDFHLRPRLVGLTDEEYFWEPVDGCWTLRRAVDGRWVPDRSPDGREPEVAPVTTIAWRIAHIGAECLASRASTFFGDTVPDDADMFDPRHLPDLPGSAAEALDFLDDAYRRWHDGIAALDDDALRRPLGPKAGGYSAEPVVGLVLHISREVMHHGGEIGVLRDLYRSRSVGAPAAG